MSIAVMVLGQSGTGKSTSLRNLDPSDTLLIQTVKKPLPFKAPNWQYYDKESAPKGNTFCTYNTESIIHLMRKTQRSIIVIDDAQYLLAREFLDRSSEKGFDKFTEIAVHFTNVLLAAAELDGDKRVYFLSHTEQTESGQIKAKTIGKMLDEKITVEGLLTIVMRTQVVNGNYVFSTRNNGSDTVKTPMGMFEAEQIPNDLAAVDAAICDYYDINSSSKSV